MPHKLHKHNDVDVDGDVKVKTNKHNSVDYPVYVYPPKEQIFAEKERFVKIVARVCDRLDLKLSDLYIGKSLVDAMHRVDQRRLHYKMYRKGMVLGELNEAALLCYWLIRYRPIRFRNDSRPEINEVIALYFLVYTVNEVRHRLLKDQKDFDPIIDDVLYAFINRSLTFDSMTLLGRAMAV